MLVAEHAVLNSLCSIDLLGLGGVSRIDNIVIVLRRLAPMEAFGALGRILKERK